MITPEQIRLFRALLGMIDDEARAAFSNTRTNAMLVWWPKFIDDILRLEEQLHANDHVQLEALVQENQDLKD